MPNVAGGTAQMALLPAISGESLDVAGGALRSVVMSPSTKYVRILAEGRCSVASGGAGVTAATTDLVIPAGIPECYGVLPGTYLSFIANP
jgi:hypothetical protein